MAEVGPPRSYPLTTLEELRYRSYFDSAYFSFNKSSVPLQKKGDSSLDNRPRLLACHDFKGGYVDDQWIQGSQNADAYTLTHWRLLDSFVYFSHNLVTLPPPCWTNAAHMHGVQVLGTFMTEWSDGAKICKELLASKECAMMYADRLAELALALGFDGWLINIENPVAAEQVDNLQEFLRKLTVAMHSFVPQSLVIWYDSVTTKGKVAYQNELNDNNKPFFDLCDGIFTNYFWKKDYPKRSAAAAGDRAFDVYMGVDVFGRDTYGGGGFQCDVALKVARDAGVSAALFAPGWSYEMNEDQERWWFAIEKSWPSARPFPVQLPFFTDFDIGLGRAKYKDGKQVSNMPWNNLSCQNLQPLLHISQSATQLVVTTSKDSEVYSGGVSIVMVGNVGHDEVCILQLYNAHAIINEASLGISYSVLAENSSSNFCLALSAVDNSGAKVIFFLLDSTEPKIQSLSPSQQFAHISAIFLRSSNDTETAALPGRGLETKKSSAVESAGSDSRLWSVRDFVVEWGQYELTDIFAICSAAKNLQPILIHLLHENETLFGVETFVNPGVQDGFELVGRLEGSGPAVGDTLPSRKNNTGAEITGALMDSSVAYSVQLGHISIASVKHEHSFTFSDPDLLGHHPSWMVNVGGDKFLSVNLRWKIPRDSNESGPWISERYYMFVGTHLEDGQTNPLMYLGMASVGAFYVYMLAVPKPCPTLTFHLHRQCGCGKVQTSGEGSTYTLQVPSRDSGNYVRTQPSLSDWLFREIN